MKTNNDTVLPKPIKGLTQDAVKTFCGIVAKGIDVSIAGSQIGLAPNEAEVLAAEQKKYIQYRTRRNNAKPTSSNGQKKTRNCLMCGATFVSKDYGHRVCDDCKSTRYWQTSTQDLSIAV